MARLPTRAEAPNTCRKQENLFFPEDLQEQITVFHRSSGFDRTIHESIRELIWQGLSGDAKSTAVRLAARRAYLDTKILMLKRLSVTLKEIYAELEQIAGITAAEASAVSALEEPPL